MSCILLRGVITANKVVDDIGVSDARFDRGGVAQVILLFPLSMRSPRHLCHWRQAHNEDNTTKIASDLQVTLAHFLAERNNNSTPLTG